MKSVSRAVALVFSLLLLGVSTAKAATPLVDVDWVKANVGKPGVVVLDIRSKFFYQRGHIPGAVHSDYRKDNWRMQKGEINGLLPPVDYLEKLIGRLGIDNDTHVVIVPGGFSAAETGSATRIYWTLKVLGHEEVSIMNGGMRAYLKDKKNGLQTNPINPEPKTFTARMNGDLLATAADVRAALANGTKLIDSRPTDQFLGINKSGSVTRHGTLPGAISLPGRWMTVNDKGKFRDKDIVSRLYASQNTASDGNTIVFCNTGHWASLGWFVESEIMGNRNAKMYDGSLADWSRLPAGTHPMSAKVNVN